MHMKIVCKMVAFLFGLKVLNITRNCLLARCKLYFISQCISYCIGRIHHNDVIMSAMASQITSLTVVYSTVYLVADQRKHQSSASLAFGRGINRWSVNSPPKMASHVGNVSIWWRRYDYIILLCAINPSRPNDAYMRQNAITAFK